MHRSRTVDSGVAAMHPVAPRARHLIRHVRRGWRAVVRWIRARTPEQVLWVFLAVVLTLYVVMLFTASTGTGRGGR